MRDPILTPEEWAMPLGELAEALTQQREWIYLAYIHPSARLKLAVRWLHEAGLFRREYVAAVQALVADFREIEAQGAVVTRLPALTELADLLERLQPPEPAAGQEPAP
jgi:hypothetical protein